MFETLCFGRSRILSVILVLLMALPVVGAGASGPGHEGGAALRATDDAKNLIVPSGDTYELCGCHTYSQSVQIDGTLKVKPYDGADDTTGTLTLWAPVITVGTSGKIVGDGRGFGGGGGGQETQTGNGPGGKGGLGGKGGDGAASTGYWGSPGGGGSNGGQPGAVTSGSTYSLPGTAGTETKGGDGGANPERSGGRGGTGFGAGGGGGAGDDWDGGGGGGGGSGGATPIGFPGGIGAGPAKGTGGLGTLPPTSGQNGGYATAGGNGDTTTDMSILKGSGGGGGAAYNPEYGGGGGGGAGGASVALVSEGNITISGSITTSGGGGGIGGPDHNGKGGDGGGGGGGGILLSGLKVSVSGTIDARGRTGDLQSVTNGGTLKMFFDTEDSGSGNIQAGRTYRNGRPKMQGLISPENDGTGLVRTVFKWVAAKDPEGDAMTYHLQVSTSKDFAAREQDKQGLTGTEYTSDTDLVGSSGYYWKVRAGDAIGYGSWTPTWKFLTDITPPESHMNALPRYTNTTNFTVSWTGTDDSSGIAGYDIFVAEGNGSLSFNPWLENTLKTSTFFEGNDGRKYSFYSVATDRGHNREAAPDLTDTSTTVDATPPVTTLAALAPYQGGLKFQLSWSGKDATSGIQYYNVFVAEGDGDFELLEEHLAKTSVQFEADDGQEYRFYVVACDNAGNWEAMPALSKILKTKVDLTPPEVTLRLGAPNSGLDPAFITAATPIYIDSTDNFAGVNGTFYIIDDRGVKPYANSIKEGAPGSHNMTYWCTDKAGNKGDAGSLWFFVDVEPPQTSIVCDGPNWTVGDKAFVTASTSITLTAKDAASGVSWIEYSLDKRGYVHYAAPLSFTSAGTHSLLYRSVDNVGNVEAEHSLSMIVDTQPPSTRTEGDLSTAISQDTTITLTATDTESGMAGTFFRVVRERGKAGDYEAGTEVSIGVGTDHSEDDNYTVQYYSVDNVNNAERVKELKIKIDTQVILELGFKREPSVSVSSYLLEGKTEPGARMTIGGADVQLSADGSFARELSLKPGKNNVVISITDPAGNTLAKTVSITYNEPLTTTGWFLPLLMVVIIAAAAGAGVFLYMRRSKGAAPPHEPGRETSRVREPPRWPPVPPPPP